MSGLAATELIMQNSRSGAVKNSMSFQICIVPVCGQTGYTTYHLGTQRADQDLKICLLSVAHPGWM